MTSTEYARRTIAGCFIRPHDGDMVSWADGKLKLPYSVRYPIFMAHESPWLLEPMRAVSDPNIRQIDVRMPAGAAKSLIGEIQIAYTIAEDPGLYYYVWQTDDDAKDAMEDRIFPMIEANELLATRMPVDRNKKRMTKVAMPHMSLYAVGANLSAAQSKRVKRLTMEEPHLYGPGMVSAFKKRVEGVRNPKILTLSTGSVVGDESDEDFLSGTCEEWQVPCPHCGQFQTMTDNRDRLRSQIDAETTDDNGEINWSKVLPTVRYNCEHCGMDWPSDEDSRKTQSRLGRYVVTNPNAAEDHRSFHMEAVSVHYFPLAQILMEKMKAVQAYKRGAIEPFKDYMQKRRAMAWDESPADTDEKASYERAKGEYFLREPHEFEIARFLCVDNQAGKASRGEGAHRWVTCRSFGPNECRLIEARKVVTWEEVEELRIELGVEPARTLVDMAFDTVNVQAVCVRYGWQGLWGDNSGKKSFPHHETIMTPQGPQRITRQYPYSPPNVGHVGIGKSGERRQARYFFWCQSPIKDAWHRLKNGLTSYRWTHAANASDEYRKQTNVEFKKQQTDSNGRKSWVWCFPSGKDNHLTDTDQMCLVAGIMDPRIRELLWTVGGETVNENAQES